MLIRALHADRAPEPHVREALDDITLLFQTVLPRELFHSEPEGYLLEVVPAVLRPPADVGVELVIVKSLAPEFVDVSGENAACY